MEGECKSHVGSAHAAAWCMTHDSLFETCQFRRIAALEAEVRRLRGALRTAAACIHERCLESVLVPGEGIRMTYSGSASVAMDAIVEALKDSSTTGDSR